MMMMPMAAINLAGREGPAVPLALQNQHVSMPGSGPRPMPGRFLDGSAAIMPAPPQRLWSSPPLAAAAAPAAHPTPAPQAAARRLTLLFSLFTAPLGAMAQNCVSLAGSNVCPAFRKASISTNAGLVSSYPFLAFVSNARQFDEQLNQYIATDYARLKYEQLLGCNNLNLSNTNPLYARYTASTICNAIVQNSKVPCALSDENSKPLCADSCAQQAISEQQIISDKQTCLNPRSGAMDHIRADFTVCSLPSESLSGDCINAALNEPENCGYSVNLPQLCAYCSKSSPNATDACCYRANVTTRCDGVRLPDIVGLPPLFPNATNTTAPISSPSPTGAAAKSRGLSGGQIAGIVIGSIVGVALLLGLVAFICRSRRRGRGSRGGSIFNQPSPPRKGGPVMAFSSAHTAASPPLQGYEVLPGGRIARMSALEGPSEESSPQSGDGAMGGVASRRHGEPLSSSEYGESPESREQPERGPLQPPPPPLPATSATASAAASARPHVRRRNESLSDISGRAPVDERLSPATGSGGTHSSPPGANSTESEQLTSFKDYYSTDEIHPGDRVATLWAYQPRAPDEFELERGDMLKVVGIWDDGWATGIRLSTRAEDWDNPAKQAQRDSGVSSSSEGRAPSPAPPGEIKAFPLVCVCLPQHWKKTLDADGTTETESSAGRAARKNE